MSEAKQKTVILALCRKLISNLIKETIEKRPGMEVIVGDGYKYADVIAGTHKPCLAVVEIPERKTATAQGDKAQNAEEQSIETQSAEAQATRTLDIFKVCDEIRDGSPGCKIILICPEKDSQSVNECVEAKQQGYIDEFLFFDATSDYLISKIEALIGEPEKNAESGGEANAGVDDRPDKPDEQSSVADKPFILNGSEEPVMCSSEPKRAGTKRKPLKYKAAYISAAACLIMICGVLILSDVVNRTPVDPNVSGDMGGSSISGDPGDPGDPGDSSDQGDPVEIDDRHVPLAAPLFPDVNAVPYEGDTDTTGNATVVATVGATVGTVDGPGYLIPDYDGKAIPVSNGRHAQITLFNHESNLCSLTFEIVLADTGKSLYKSGLVTPGMCIKNVELDEAPGNGEHTAILIISAYDTSNLEIMNNTRMEIALTPSS